MASKPTAIPVRKIHYSEVRARRGLKPYTIMEVVAENFSRGISLHQTKEEAEAALAKLNGRGAGK